MQCSPVCLRLFPRRSGSLRPAEDAPLSILRFSISVVKSEQVGDEFAAQPLWTAATCRRLPRRRVAFGCLPSVGCLRRTGAAERERTSCDVRRGTSALAEGGDKSPHSTVLRTVWLRLRRVRCMISRLPVMTPCVKRLTRGGRPGRPRAGTAGTAVFQMMRARRYCARVRCARHGFGLYCTPRHRRSGSEVDATIVRIT